MELQYTTGYANVLPSPLAFCHWKTLVNNAIQCPLRALVSILSFTSHQLLPIYLKHLFHFLEANPVDVQLCGTRLWLGNETGKLKQ